MGEQKISRIFIVHGPPFAKWTYHRFEKDGSKYMKYKETRTFWKFRDMEKQIDEFSDLAFMHGCLFEVRDLSKKLNQYREERIANLRSGSNHGSANSYII